VHAPDALPPLSRWRPTASRSRRSPTRYGTRAPTGWRSSCPAARRLPAGCRWR
jgi:hypothetical protein